MNISTDNAMQIVTEISNIINQHVNMMNESGIIIASTDSKRIGTYHEGSARVISDNLEKLVIWDDAEYKGARKGINLPILFDGEIVGVIGITGEHDEVVKYGQIIKKMTEILILENYSKEQKKIDERIKARFFDDWLREDAIPYTRQMLERGERLGIDLTIPRRVLIAEIADLKKYSDTPEGQRIINHVNKTVRMIVEENMKNVFTKTTSQMICLIADCDDTKMRAIAEDIQRQIKRLFGLLVIIGVDERGSILPHALLKAKKAFHACALWGKSTLCFYDEINIEIFIDEISQQSKEKFFRRVFRGFPEDEIASWIQLLQVYFNVNGSISEAARQLYIHKNTLQYKLRRLHEQTGYDPRNLSDSALFYLAIQFYSENKNDHNPI